MKEPKKNMVVTLTMTGYASDGAGVSRLEDGRVVFVKGALRGEVCRVQLLKVGKSSAWGRVEEVMEPSPERRVPDCPYYPQCGGCQLRHMSYEEELSFKQDRVQEALRRIGGAETAVSVIHGAPEVLRYRNKIQFPVGDGGIGFYRARSHQVIDAADCLLQPMEATRLRNAVKVWVERYQVSSYDERQHQGLLRHVYVRTSRMGESLCALVVNGREIPHQGELLALLQQAEPKLVGVVLAVNRERTNVILGKEYRTLWGQDFLEDVLCGFTFRLSVPSFYQVNREQTQVLYSRALEFAGLTGSETVLDLYCGIGTITSVMAQKAKRVIGAEVVPQAVEDARENALRNGLDNVEFLCGDAGEAARELAERGLQPHVVCVDPPRKGLSPMVIEAIIQMAPERVVYVSCDPGTLGRDVKLFSERGYTLQRAEACDLFPRTNHVEACVLLSHKCLE
ncbi:MAG: rRNA (uracil-5-)-methyltransferase RumA [Firmicutes bacterium]|nr:rRNA (uracil-5-)-methyltransferase RumA [Bacillota bacterium]